MICIANCGYLMLQEMNSNTSESVIIIGGGYTQQDWPVSEGTNATLSCPPRLTLSGPNITTCMGNGEWVPDLREVECKGEYMHLLVLI